MKADIFYFSATGTTKEIAKAVADGLHCEVLWHNLTLPGARKDAPISEGDIVLIAAPVYGERIPNFIINCLKGLQGRGRPLIGVSVYGNMGYGISLEQYASLAAENDFVLIAAGAFVAQHTYADMSAPVGLGRPNAQDLSEAEIFGIRVREKLELQKRTSIATPKSKLPKFLANTPEGTVRAVIRAPRVDRTLCNSCGACVKRCPLGAIDPVSLEIDERKCMRCLACVQICSQNARTGEFRARVFKSIFAKIGKKPASNSIFID
jgi:ferredoxin